MCIVSVNLLIINIIHNCQFGLQYVKYILGVHGVQTLHQVLEHRSITFILQISIAGTVQTCRQESVHVKVIQVIR